MIRVESFDAQELIPVLSGIIYKGDNSHANFSLATTIMKIYPPNEAHSVSYLIMSAINELRTIYLSSKLSPSLCKESILTIIEGNIYEELKENKNAGFAEYARTRCQIVLNEFNDEELYVVADSLLNEVNYVLDEAESLNYTPDYSMGLVVRFLANYEAAVLGEAGRVLEMISNSDFAQIHHSLPGWSKFLNWHKVRSVGKGAQLLALLSNFLMGKRTWYNDNLSVLTDITQYNEIVKEAIDASIPLLDLPFGKFSEIMPVRKGEITTIVGNRGGGKTTFAGIMCGIALADGLAVLIYSPEIKRYKILNNIILPAYIMRKYGFLVTAQQVYGFEEPYEQGSDYTVEEKKAIIKKTIDEVVHSGKYFHVSEYYHVENVDSMIQSHAKMVNADLVVLDHTMELRGSDNNNIKTEKFAEAAKDLVKMTNAHVVMLSQPQKENFKSAMPTAENPYPDTTKRIVAYSQAVESLSDNIIGIVGEGDMLKVFYSKLRNGVIPPMYQVLRINHSHAWIEYLPGDQFQTESGGYSPEDIYSKIIPQILNSEGEADNEDDDGFEDGY